ncbi:MAG TPA: carboxypeptidase regulatory-like domain-containing protein [Anaerolineales bacterium]|nr:carboxypeptidase regulatory-like domain-containing protein [Anaerolineales bacterium]
MNRNLTNLARALITPLFVALAAMLSGCSQLPVNLPWIATPAATVVPDIPPAETPLPPPPIEVAEVTFRVTIPGDTPSDGPIQVSLLDEVTGLALNQAHYEMQAESPNIYAVTLRLPAHAMITYRYTRGAELLAAEHTSDGRPVRYRLIHTTASGSVHDIVTRWNDTGYSGPTGRITGTVTDAETGRPLPNIMVTAGGQTTFTHWDGTYLIEGLPPGTHNLVAYALDGGMSIFQQGAVVATQAATPADIALAAAALTTVTFVVDVPEDAIPAVPIRIAGNLFQLGNVFADLSGGISTPASRLPRLKYDPDGYYLVTMQLPAGAYVRYKYTLGDGFWNMETDPNGGLVLREFIVPEMDTIINDTIAGWRSPDGNAPVWFSVIVPGNTPPEDTVWLQLNPWGWTEPLPMWRTGPNEWVYLLSSPLSVVGQVEFRFCRNGDCNLGREATAEAVRTFSSADSFQAFEGAIDRWVHMADFAGRPPVPSAEIVVREAGFTAGYAFPPVYHTSWLTDAAEIFSRIKSSGANSAVIAPTWSATRSVPPVFDAIPGSDSPWLEAVALAQAARAAGLEVVLFPQHRLPVSTDQWWLGVPRDYGWWVNWFEQYEIFIRHHAALADQTGARTLVLGGSWLDPAYPEGLMPDGFTSGVPAEAETWWRDILASVREMYGGRLALSLSMSGDLDAPPAVIDAFDEVHVVWDVPLAESPDADLEDMLAAAGSALENRLLPFYLEHNRPIVLVLSFPAADGAALGCVPTEGGGCQPLDALDLEEQLLMYEAVLRAVNERDWIAGVISAGYYPMVEARDPSESVHGKPSGELIAAWFAGWLPGP